VVSGFDVLDIDPRHGGNISLEELEAQHNKLPETVEQLTGGGGRHTLFRHREGVHNKVSLAPGLDIRGEGGYIVVAPSAGRNRQYAWELSSRPGEVEIAEWPAWLLELVQQPANGKPQGPAPPVEGPIPEGQRNTTLTSLAGTMRRRGMIETEILAALKAVNETRCQPPLPDEEVERVARSVSSYEPTTPIMREGSGSFGSAPRKDSSQEEWPEPQPLPDSLPAVEPFEFDLLPKAFSPWVEDIAERMQCPPDYLGVGAMVALSTVAGRQVGIHPKQQDDWLVVPNLWGAVIGPPSLMKSPSLQEILASLHRLESRARESYDLKLLLHEADQIVAEAKNKNAQDELRKAIKAGKDTKELSLACVSGTKPPPARQRYVVNDPTVEKLGEILSANPRGVLLFRDELIGFLRTLEREGHEADRAFYLESWNGTGRFTCDRIGRGTIEIEAACISILGGITPGPLGAYVRAAAQGKGGDDGLIQRFQLAVFPDISPTWENHDRPPDLEARSRAWEVFKCLDTLDSKTVGAEVPDSRFDRIPFLRFTPGAQEIFTSWRTDLELRLRRGEDPPILEAHLGKYRSLVPSLALLIHLADTGAGPVGEEALNRARAWAKYLESHARRVYSPAVSPTAAAAKTLAGHILKGDLKESFTVRDAYRNQWRGLTDREEVAQGLDLLEALDWVHSTEERGVGRPTTIYHVNPKVFKKEDGNG
jgi:putative DNA primase/helicase